MVPQSRGRPQPGSALVALENRGRLHGRDGVADVQLEGAALSLKVSGSIDAVIHEVAKHKIVDFICERPSLESAFVQLYENDGEAKT